MLRNCLINYQTLSPEVMRRVFFFKKYVSRLAIHRDRFNDNHRKIIAFKHCLCGQALVWWTGVNGGINARVAVPDLQAMFFAKYRYRKSHIQLKAELNKCKYMPSQSNLGMMNTFLIIADKLEWPLPVQIDCFIKLLPMSLRQFVISRTTNDFEVVRESIRVFQDMLEVDVVTHSFKNVSFADNTCILCGEDHNLLRCPSLKSVIEMETSSKEKAQPRSRSASPDRLSNGKQWERSIPFNQKQRNWAHTVITDFNIFESMLMDLKVMPSSDRGYNHLLVMRCNNSHYIITGALKTRQAT